MTDAQILSIAIMVLTVLAGAFFSNLRVGDQSKRIDDLRDSFRAVLQAEGTALRAEMAKNHSEMLNRFGDLDERLTRIEQRFMR